MTSIVLFSAVIAGAWFWGGEDVLRLEDEVAFQVHSTVDWSDPGSIALDRYTRALGLTLEPLARFYEAASGTGTRVDIAVARDALAAAAALAAEAAEDAPEGLAPLERLFADYLRKAGTMLDAWDPAQGLSASLAETFEAQHALNDALQDATEVRLLRDLRAHETDRGYAYHHRLVHYHGYRAMRAATGAMTTADELRRALTDYFDAEVALQRFLEDRSRIHDGFVPFVEASANLGKAMADLVKDMEDEPADQWFPRMDAAAVVDAFGDLRAQRHHLLRLERIGEL